MHNDASTKIKHATIGVSILSGSESGSYTVGYTIYNICNTYKNYIYKRY